MLRNWM